MNCKKNIDKQATGLKLYRLIQRSGLSYSDIASYLDLSSPRVIYAWTDGTKLPSLQHLYNLASLLHVHMEDILST